jgi:hypothetical protein
VPVLFAPSASLAGADDQPQIDRLYAIAASRAAACLLRISPAATAARADLGGKRMYIEDGLHPTPISSFLTAAAIVRRFEGRLNKLPTSIRGEPIDPGEGRYLGGETTLVTIPMDLGRSTMKWSTLASTKRSNGKPPSLAPLRLRASKRQFTFAAPAGEWTGPLRLYPVSTIIRLLFSRDAAGLSVNVQIKSGDKVVKEGVNLPVRIDRATLSFEFPGGPNGTKIDFLARFETAARIRGIARFASVDHSLEGEGTWEAVR